ncbi:SAM-dependent methyltransferase [Actinoplanes regularis]|uniref:SAM-dependent methyltransferase n=1 Tax=Actinoplanes regularis TaxID=52697 RepID=UPI0015C5BAEB|nr:SAM-dependent methyltransferase [Actinoplanes regularis]
MTLDLQSLFKETLTRVWHVPILKVLGSGPARYADIRDGLVKLRESSPGDGTISTELRILRSKGLVEQLSQPNTTKKLWALTDLGKTVLRLIDEVDSLTNPENFQVKERRIEMPISDSQERAAAIDPTVPHPARRYDYLLGGKDNFAADRESAHEIEAVMPTVRLAARENRGFLQRAVKYLAGEGVSQFLDIGSGIPTSPNTHEIAQAIDPAAQVVYVDNDPLVLTHARALLTSTPEGKTAYINADLRDPEGILNDDQLRSTIDLSKPIGIILVAVLHFIRDDEDPKGIITRIIGSLAPGSWVVISHVTFDHMPSAALSGLEKPNRDGRFRARSRDELADFMTGLDLMDPGIQSIAHWWADEAPQPRPTVEDVAIYGAIGRVKAS